jgi:hypothetical protein
MNPSLVGVVGIDGMQCADRRNVFVKERLLTGYVCNRNQDAEASSNASIADLHAFE